MSHQSAKIIWDLACKQTLKALSETFADPNRLVKDPIHKEYFQVISEMIKKYPYPKYPKQLLQKKQT